jgi:cytochrome b pre-mRNA-processing protein 3
VSLFLYGEGMTIWSKILNKAARREPHRAVYEAIVAAARRPALYTDFGAPDTVSGRFDMIVLHAFLVLERVKDSEPAFAQALTDELFRDMDRSLREMGVGDISVGKRVRALAEAFTGRLAAYRNAIADPKLFAEALDRNIWADGPGGKSSELAQSILELRRKVSAQLPADIAAGRIALS